MQHLPRKTPGRSAAQSQLWAKEKCSPAAVIFKAPGNLKQARREKKTLWKSVRSSFFNNKSVCYTRNTHLVSRELHAFHVLDKHILEAFYRLGPVHVGEQSSRDADKLGLHCYRADVWEPETKAGEKAVHEVMCAVENAQHTWTKP